MRQIRASRARALLTPPLFLARSLARSPHPHPAGDFSWSASVARTGCLLTATSLDSASEVLRKHGDRAAKALAALSKAPGAVVRHGFDATTPPPPVGQHGRRYDFVVFNFPHTGSDEGEVRNGSLAGVGVAGLRGCGVATVHSSPPRKQR